VQAQLETKNSALSSELREAREQLEQAKQKDLEIKELKSEIAVLQSSVQQASEVEGSLRE